MIDEIERLISEYLAWLRDKTVLREVKGWVEITTPHLDRHNDCLQIYVAKRDGQYLLTDDGYVINDLMISGCQLDTPKRKQLLDMTLNGLGVQRNDNRLEVLATEASFATKKHGLIQAMLAVNDMFFMAAPTVASLFYEDVVDWMDVSRVRYSPHVRFVGKSGFEHAIDFVIPKSPIHPERMVEAVSRPVKQAAQVTVFKLNDIREARPIEARMYVLLNDRGEVGVSPEVVEAFAKYDVKPVLWSQRDSVREELAA